MSQTDVYSYSSDFLPHLGELPIAPLTSRQLERLYALTDWQVILPDRCIRRMYQQFPAVSLFKALALPYLINIPSERALARELHEREPLRAVCGFLPEQTPTRATFWHFRRRYAHVYPELMLRVLITLVLSEPKPHLALPFASPISQTAVTPQGRYSTFQLDLSPSLIEVWTTGSEAETGSPLVTRRKTFVELGSEMANRRRKRPRKKGLATDLGLPAEVRTELYNGQIVRFQINKPEWLDSRTGQIDTLTTVGAAASRPYTACHVLVIRKHQNKQQVLLSRRLAGYGKGTYILPGGKQHPDESLQQCAARELLEETGLHLLKSRPVSWHRNRLPGKPPVLSVGVLAEEYSGLLQHREPSQNTAWQWFDLDNLPAPLFEPARVVIAHHIKGTSPNLQWQDVEAQVAEVREPLRQLKMPGIDRVDTSLP